MPFNLSILTKEEEEKWINEIALEKKKNNFSIKCSLREKRNFSKYNFKLSAIIQFDFSSNHRFKIESNI